jgi:hypothetical protein
LQPFVTFRQTSSYTVKAVTEKLRLLNDGNLVAASCIDPNAIDDDFDADEDIKQHAASSKFKVKSLVMCAKQFSSEV